jgi:hypothetical protein
MKRMEQRPCFYCNDKAALRACFADITTFHLGMDGAGEFVFESELLRCRHVHVSVLSRNAYPVAAGAFGLIERLVGRLN